MLEGILHFALYFREGLEQHLLHRVFDSAPESRIGGGLESEVAAELASDLLDPVREALGLISYPRVASFTEVCPGNRQISVEDILNALAPYRWHIDDRQPACKIAVK